jgi:hypothetical protein
MYDECALDGLRNHDHRRKSLIYKAICQNNSSSKNNFLVNKFTIAMPLLLAYYRSRLRNPPTEFGERVAKNFSFFLTAGILLLNYGGKSAKNLRSWH